MGASKPPANQPYIPMYADPTTIGEQLFPTDTGIQTLVNVPQPKRQGGILKRIANVFRPQNSTYTIQAPVKPPNNTYTAAMENALRLLNPNHYSKDPFKEIK